MAQKTNLNVSPYYDDFNPENNYHKVLFKPGYPVQARELTTLQSILQHQIEQNGRHFFKEGSVVIPGSIKTDIPVPLVKVEDTYNGTPISLYFDKLNGKKLRGAVSGVLAEVVFLLDREESEEQSYTLYLRYLQNGGVNFENTQFFDGESLVLQSDLTYGNLGYTIPSGEGICSIVSTNSKGFGSIAFVTEGVYFVRGFFVDVKPQKILLDQYGVVPSYKIGFDIVESIVSANQDGNLYDNAKGFSNYTAPGADRLKIQLILAKRAISDNNDENFFEVVRIDGGVLIFKKETTQYSLIRDELARRTFDESGDFYVKPFDVTILDSFNDRIKSGGVYYDGQTTADGRTPSDDLMLYRLSPGKAYVSGYDVEKISSTEITVPKARTTQTVENEVIFYEAGASIIVNNGYGSPVVGVATTAYVDLMDSRIGVSSHVAAGATIGVARVYDFIPESDYVDDTSRLNLRLFDIQTFTTVGLTTNITLSTPAFIKGKKSEATGYLRTSVTNDRTLTLYEVTGSFLENEGLYINGILDGRLINEVRDYDMTDVKSVYARSNTTTGISTFNADVVLNEITPLAPPGSVFKVTRPVSGVSTVSIGLDVVFTNLIKPGDIISYSGVGTQAALTSGDVVYNKVNSVAADGLSFTITGITTVTGICDGSIPTPTVFSTLPTTGALAGIGSTQIGFMPFLTVNNIVKVTGSADESQSSLMTKLKFDNISSVSLESQEILQRRQFTNVSFSSNFIQVSLTEPDLYFASFDEDRFVIQYSDGSIEPMRSDKYNLDTTGKILTFYGLGRTSGTANVITTIKNVKPSFKQKNLNKASTLTINYSSNTSSGIGTTTLNDGLTYSSVYGVRVQDEDICLNVPDVLRVLAIYESTDTSDPQLPKIVLTQFTGGSNTNEDFVIGEQIQGQKSNAVAIVVSRISTDSLEIVYLNENTFTKEEVIEGKDSKVRATITSVLITSSKNITQNFYLDDGQRPSIYDYSRITRAEFADPPTKKIKVVFQNYTINSGDTGEFISVNSYPNSSYKSDIPLYSNDRGSDYLDTRPRVSPFVLGSSSKSPFEFDSRRFDGAGQYAKYSLCPNENIIISYSYYLPRVDLIYLNSSGDFKVIQGTPNESPLVPTSPSNAFEVANVFVPPYVFDVNNIRVDTYQHRRYRMADIGLLEDRIRRVEEFTVLNSLETKAEKLNIKDAATGLNRFKCGFFVDNFTSATYQDIESPLFRASIDPETQTLRPESYVTTIDLELGHEGIVGFSTNITTTDIDKSNPLTIGDDTGVRKNNELVTLAYSPDIIYDQQLFASTTEFVTPYLTGYWQGFLSLSPRFETWIEEKTITTTVQEGAGAAPTPVTPVVNNTDGLPIQTKQPAPNVGVGGIIFVLSGRSRLGRFIRQHHFNNRVFSTIQDLQNTIPPGQFGGFATEIFRRRGRNIFFSRDIKDRRLTISVISGDTIRLTWRGWGVRKLTRSQIDLINRVVPPDVATDFINQIRRHPRKPRKRIIVVEYKLPTPTTPTTPTLPPPVEPPVEPPTAPTTNETTTSTSIELIRSRNVEFIATRLKPRSLFVPFFENVNMSSLIIPKLLEIRMVSGTFQVGETVESDPVNTSAQIKFRLCTPNHKEGSFNSPNKTYKLNPYNLQAFEEAYSPTSTILNVDTRALQLPTETEFFGYITDGLKLIGKTSGAVAVIDQIRLLSDSSGNLIGAFFIPNPNIPGNPKWRNGDNVFKLISYAVSTGVNNIDAQGINDDSSAESIFTSAGTSIIHNIKIITPAPKPPVPPPPPPPPVDPCTGLGSELLGVSVPSANLDPASNPDAQDGWYIYGRSNNYPNFGSAFGSVGSYDPQYNPFADVARLVIKWKGQVIWDGKANTAARDRRTNWYWQLGTFLPKFGEQSINNLNVFPITGAGLKDAGNRQNSGTQGPNEIVVDGALPTTSLNNIATRTQLAGKRAPVGLKIGQYTYFPVIGSQKVTPSVPKPSGVIATNNVVFVAYDVVRKESICIPRTQPKRGQVDPLAQSFIVDDTTGIFLTGVDIFFELKDDELPVTLQIRTMIAGVPSETVIPFSEVTLDPDQVNISENGSVPTRFSFKDPVYLSGPVENEATKDRSTKYVEYAIVLLAETSNYKVFISRLGQNDILSGEKIASQPTLGSLFKSQNATTWNPSQYEDLKYKLYRASFVSEGTVRFFNSDLAVGNNKFTVTSTNNFFPVSKRIIVGLGSTGFDRANVVPGVNLVQGTATGTLIGLAGSVSSAIVAKVGTGYTQGTFTGISLQTETGYGRGAVATIGVTTVGIATVTITSGGFGYLQGDTLKIPRINNLGVNGKVTVTAIGSTNAFLIDNVQGQFTAGITTINYINSSGISTQVGAAVTISTIVQDQFYDGLHMRVLHQNHGMHSAENYVTISEFRPTTDEVNSTLTEVLTTTSTTIPVQSGVGFTTFERIAVSPANPGYVIVDNEIIGYTSVAGNTLISSIPLRGIDGTQIVDHDTSSPVFKYEFNGISIRRINKTHNFAEVDLEKHPIELDSYYIKIDNGSTDFDNVGIGSDRTNDLYFNETIQSGRAGTVLSNNIQYEMMIPNVNNVIPSETSMDARVRTFTGTSIGGNEKSFEDAGFQSIPLNSTIMFQSPRLICSPVNQQRFITESLNKKSLGLDIVMKTNDERVSPVIDVVPPPFVVLSSNRLNNPVGLTTVSLYADSEFVRSDSDDLHTSIYVSKPIGLSIPANQLTVLLSANKNDTNDIRVLYQISRVDAAVGELPWELFPGYSNYRVDGVGRSNIDPSISDGSSDFVAKEPNDGQFKEYRYTADNLPQFTSFAIKIVMAGTNQAQPPLISDLRAIATTVPKV